MDCFLIFTSLFFSFFRELAGIDGSTTFSLLVYMPIFMLFAKYYKPSLQCFMPLLFAFAFIFVALFSPYSGYNWRTAINLTIIPMILWIYCKINMGYKERRQLFILILVIFVFFHFVFVENNQLNGNVAGRMYFNFFWIFLSLSNTIRNQRRLFKGILVLVMMICLVQMWQYNCRTAILISIALVLVYYFVKNPPKSSWPLHILMIGGIVFPLLYVYVSSISSYISFMGKNLFSGRDELWEEIFRQLKEINHFLYGGVYISWWDLSFHNSFLTIIAGYGFSIYMLLWLSWGRIFNYLKLYFPTTSPKFLLMIVIAYIYGYAEAYVIMDTLYIALPLCFIPKKRFVTSHQ